MDEDRITKKALFRYQIISAFLAADPPRGSRYKLLEQLAAKQWVLEDGRTLIVQPETIRYWIRLYRTGGFEALKDVPRKDTGVRSIPGGLVEEACRLKKEVPERSIEQIITIMERMGKAPEGLLARSTLHRALRARGLSARSRKPPAHSSLGRFQADYANDLWQADMLTGPWLPDPDRPGKHRRCYLYAFLDDASRLLLYGRFSFKGDLPALELVMKRCASLGMHKTVFTTPYRPEGHGKIEAFNRFCRSRFIAELKASSIRTLDELNEAYLAWLDQDYNKRTHGELGTSPMERWLKDADRIEYVDEQKLTRAFLFKLDRTTDKCAVFKLHGRRYQCDWQLAKKKMGLPAQGADQNATDYLNFLVQERRQSLPAPSTPVDDNRLEAFVALLKGRLAEEIFEEAAVRDFWTRFGPLELEHTEQRLNEILEAHPANHHIGFYLEALRHTGDPS